ncbi:hypothetical protein ACIBCE_52480, partial [Streptomyces sp. NPDC051554]
DINCTQGVLKDNSLWGSAGPDTITITRDGVFTTPALANSAVVEGSVEGRGGDDTITITTSGTTILAFGNAGISATIGLTGVGATGTVTADGASTVTITAATPNSASAQDDHSIGGYGGFGNVGIVKGGPDTTINITGGKGESGLSHGDSTSPTGGTGNVGMVSGGTVAITGGDGGSGTVFGAGGPANALSGRVTAANVTLTGGNAGTGDTTGKNGGSANTANSSDLNPHNAALPPGVTLSGSENSTLKATGGTPSGSATAGAGNTGTITGPKGGEATINVTGGSVPEDGTGTIGSGNTGTITGGDGNNTITASAGTGPNKGDAKGNTKGAVIDGNVEEGDETTATCIINGGDDGDVKNCTEIKRNP